jgi:hypothetical protein
MEKSREIKNEKIGGIMGLNPVPTHSSKGALTTTL